MLLFLIVLPLFGAVFLTFLNKTSYTLIRNFSLFWSLVIFNFSIILLFFFDFTKTDLQLIDTLPWFDGININLIVGIDGLALIMILLSAFLIPTCIMLC